MTATRTASKEAETRYHAQLADLLKRINDLQSTLKSSQTEASHYRAQSADLREQVQGLRLAVTSSEAEAARYLAQSADLSEQVQSLQLRLVATEQKAARKNEDLTERLRHIRLNERKNASTLNTLQQHVRELRHAAETRELAVYDLKGSTSWRITAPLRGIKLKITGGVLRNDLPSIPAPLSLASQSISEVATDLKKPTMAFFTICSRNFLAFARTLYDSLRKHHPESQFYVALCDAPEPPFAPDAEPFPFLYLDDIDLPQWREMSHRYNITEFNTAIKPFVIAHLMRKGIADCIVYLDPDIIVTSHMQELESAFADGASVIVTPHVTVPAENVEVSDIKMLQYGIYNLGFVGFRCGTETMKVVEWWGRQLIDHCVIKLEQGLFVDQKWADLLPAFLDRSLVLRHPGYNVAYWNVAQRNVVRSGDGWLVNGEPLRFAHFSGCRLDDSKVYSRHSGQFDASNIGDLKFLLDEYRNRVLANGHHRYQAIPYAFSWNGAAGINQHTPQPEGGGDGANTVAVGQGTEVSNLFEATAAIVSAVRQDKVVSDTETHTQLAAVDVLRTSEVRENGFLPLAKKVSQVFAKEMISGVRTRIKFLRPVNSAPHSIAPAVLAEKPTELLHSLQDDGARREHQTLSARRKRLTDIPPVERASCKLLFIDWSTPRPDRDAGSLTAYHLMQILTNLGYAVTFVPSDLNYLGHYTEALRSIGVRCLHREDIGSVKNHLEQEGADYAFAYLCRAPIAMHYCADVRQHAPNAKIILNTSDLHFLRDIRTAELDGSREKMEAALAWKQQELSTINSCDLTIVMSPSELEILKKEAPAADVRLIPLMFLEITDDAPPHAARRDILFIGGFPHLPNVDAVLYFAKEIFPRVRTQLPDVCWHIVGNEPPSEVTALSETPGIVVHGYMHDIAPLFRQVRLSVAPLRVGAGIKGKLGTSLSFGVPAVATTIAVEGMPLEDGRHVAIADEPGAFADAIVKIYGDEALWSEMSYAGRKAMLDCYSVPAGHRRIGALMDELSEPSRRIDVFDLRSRSAYLQLKEVMNSELITRRQLEHSLIQHDKDSFLINGFCAVCGSPSTFNTSFMYAYDRTEDGQPVPNWREHLDCTTCRMQNRIRAALHLFYALLHPAPNAKIYITEQMTPMFQWLKMRHPELEGSEYFGQESTLGSVRKGIRNEDMTQLTFADGSFDFVLSFDVMEHVADELMAIKEVYRCLRPGGRFFFAAPFAHVHAKKTIRARMLADGTIHHIMPPEYHGNPIDPEGGALCFRYFAWDLLDDLREAGFSNSRVLHYWSRDFAYLGVEQFLFVAEKLA